MIVTRSLAFSRRNDLRTMGGEVVVVQLVEGRVDVVGAFEKVAEGVDVHFEGRHFNGVEMMCG